MFGLACTLLVLGLAGYTNALYFYVAGEHARCVQKEVYSGVTITGLFRLESYDEKTKDYSYVTAERGVRVNVFDTDRKILFSRIYALEADRFQFISENDGRVHVCMTPNVSLSSPDNQRTHQYRVYLRFEPSGRDYISKRDEMQRVQSAIHSVLGRFVNVTHSILTETTRARKQETVFRKHSELTNHRVLVWMIVQAVIAIGLSFWQYFHLKKFIVRKKFV